MPSLLPNPSSPLATPRVAVYPGTFDPFTLGHADVVRRAAALFDGLVIAVALAHHKKTLFSLAERVALVEAATRGIPGVTVQAFEGLLTDFCTGQNASVLVRGLRSVSDFDHEAQLAAMNRKLNGQVETVFLLTEAKLQCISSSLVREISQLGGDVSALVSPVVVAALAKVHQPAHQSVQGG